MTWEELKKQQQEELAYYWKDRSARQTELRDEQEGMWEHLSPLNPEGRVILNRVIRQQNEDFMNRERDELDLLLHAQECERRTFFEKETLKNKIRLLIGREPDRDRER